MESLRLTPLFVKLVAGLAVLYWTNAVICAPGVNSAPATTALASHAAPPEGEAASLGFPAAKDLVSEFLFSGAGNQAPPLGHGFEEAYGIEFIIATVPDPITSRLPHFFDSFLESMESATEAAGYTPDRYVLPWTEKDSDASDHTHSSPHKLYQSAPGLILFRNPHDRKLLLILLVGETPTTGIHKQALFSALEQVAQFYPWSPKHAELPPGFPVPESSPDNATPQAAATFRIMGPSFSGSAVSLRFVLDKWSESHGNIPNIKFQIISGTATAINVDLLSQSSQFPTTFQATVPPDDETRRAVACYIRSLGYKKIAILTEGNTAYGQNFTKSSALENASGDQTHGDCGNGQELPKILSLPFPLHISRLREATSKPAAQGQAAPETGSGRLVPSPPAQESAAEPREVLPAFSDLTVQAAELTLSNLLSTIAREQYSYVGIVATDPRDVTFLAREVRRHAPATILFTLNSDLLYAYTDVNSATHGMIIFTPYPLFNLEQLWTYSFGGNKSRLQFSNQAAEGVYNATLALLHKDEKLVDYGRPLAFSADAQPAERRKPSLWVTAIGNEETLPVRLLDVEDNCNYMYPPDSSVEAAKASGKPCRGTPPDPLSSQPVRAQRPAVTFSVGRGIYAENSVVAVIALSILISAFSLWMVSQYGRREKVGEARIFALLEETASPAYWSECRLFLLCGSVSLLAFYTVVWADFCLPFLAAWEKKTSIDTTATPKVAAVIGIVTILLLLLAIHALVSAFRQAPSDQCGAAPEVVLFALIGCVLVFILAGVLDILWVGQVRADPASGLFNHLRSFDLGGGLSPLLPLACVALGGFLWALCSFRRLRILDILRATGTAERPHVWLSFLCLDVPSFRGVRELENSLKHILESSTVMSLKWYATLLAVALNVWMYFFYHHLVRALEVRPFYWLFGAAFFIVYWALLMEFLRLVFAWRSLHLLLRRLSWHPLVAAFKRYRENRPNLAKMNLTHPPLSFAALESSVNQANRLLRTAQTLAQKPETEEDWRNMFRQSLPEWEAQIQNAESQLDEALRVQWADDAERPSLVERAPIKRASRVQGNRRESLKSRCLAHHALLRVTQSLGKAMEGYWSSLPAEGAPRAIPSGVKEFLDQGEEFIVSRFVNLLAIALPSLQNLGYFVLAGLLLMLLAVTSYPFQPRNEFLFFNWVVILSFVGTVFWIFVQMDRDTVLSLLNDTKPGQITFSRELVLRTLLYVAVPLLALLGAQFPESLRQVLSIFTAAQGSP